MIMGLQPFNGHEIAIEIKAAELIPFYSIVKFNSSDKSKCNLAGAGDVSIGIAIPTEEEMMNNSDDTARIVRNGYQIGETVTVYDIGTVYVILGAIVSAGDKCVPMAGGLGAKLAADSFTPWGLAATPANTAINTAGNLTITEIEAILTARDTVVGKYLTAGNIGDIIPIKLR
jgi:hypothetical protein